MTHPFSSAAAATQFALDWLHAQGYSIKLPVAEVTAVTVGELRGRLNLASGTLAKRMLHPDCPLFRAERGPSGRILRLWPTPELLAFLSRPLRGID